METMANNGIMCRGTMEQDMPFWAEADCGNFGSLLRGMGYCSAARSGSVPEPVEAREVIGKRVEDREGVGRGLGGSGEVREGSGRSWENAEEAGRHGKVTLCYTLSYFHLRSPSALDTNST